MKNELNTMIPNFYNFLESYLKNVTLIRSLPSAWRNAIGSGGLSAFKFLLQLTWEITKPFTPSRFNDEIDAMASASGVDVWELRGLNMVPELLKAWCSIIGVWGKASATGNVLQLRALDWDPSAPIA